MTKVLKTVYNWQIKQDPTRTWAQSGPDTIVELVRLSEEEYGLRVNMREPCNTDTIPFSVVQALIEVTP